MPIAKSITPTDAVVVLNRAFANDPAAIATLIGVRIPCNEKMRDDPTIICDELYDPVVGIVGILNGLFGVEDTGQGFWGVIAVKYENDGGKPVGFCLTDAGLKAATGVAPGSDKREIIDVGQFHWVPDSSDSNAWFLQRVSDKRYLRLGYGLDAKTPLDGYCWVQARDLAEVYFDVNTWPESALRCEREDTACDDLFDNARVTTLAEEQLIRQSEHTAS